MPQVCVVISLRHNEFIFIMCTFLALIEQQSLPNSW